MIPRDGHTFATGRVVKRARDDTGELIGKTNSNPFLDTSVYEVEFEDGAVEKYHANVIAENIYSRIDEYGTNRYVLDEVLEHKADDTALKQSEGFTVGRRGEKVPKQTEVLDQAERSEHPVDFLEGLEGI